MRCRQDLLCAVRSLTTAVNRLNERIDIMAQTQADLDASLKSLTDAVTALAGPVNSLIAAVQAHPAAADFSAEVAQVQAAQAQLASLTTAASAAAPAAPATTSGSAPAA